MKLARFFVVFTFLLAFAYQVSAQSNPYPNELKGYEFFGDGKLKGLQLGISSKEDVIRIFGDDCEKTCVYDEGWKIKFDYFNNWTKANYQGNMTRKYISASEFAGKLWLVEMFPTEVISFSKMTFPNLFKQSNDVITGQGIKSALRDTIGLSYVFESESGICEPTKFGNLLAIRYHISDEIDKKAWILIQQEDNVQK